MSILEFVNQSKKIGLSYAVYRNWHQPTPNWDEFKSLCTEIDGRISIKNKPYGNIFKFFLDESIKAYPNIEYEFFIIQCSTYRNLHPAFSGTDMHSDPSDTLHWQCRGVSEWIIGENKESILLEPGDLIWFTPEVQHEVQNLTEKYSLVFTQDTQSLFYDKNGNPNQPNEMV